ncbi:MAG: exonuclease domain-containing protein [bacterium]
MFGLFDNPVKQRERALRAATATEMQSFLGSAPPGKNTPCEQVQFVSLDLETTGTDPVKDQILSIGFIEIQQLEIELGSAWHRIVTVDEAIPEASAIVHQITDDQSADGEALDLCLPEVLERLAGKVLIAHYSPIERQFLDAACQRLYGSPFLMPVVDTLQLAKRRFDLQNHAVQPGDLRLFNLRPRFNLPRYRAHDALLDALATAELFLALLAEIHPKGSAKLAEVLTH